MVMINEQYKYSDLTSKVIGCLEDVHFAQAINYLVAYNLEFVLLINFGERSLNFKCLQNKKFKKS